MKSNFFQLTSFVLILASSFSFPATLLSQEGKGMDAVTRCYAITDVTIIPAPGITILHGTIVIKDGLIVQAGKDIPIPVEALIIRADSMFAYAGFIDGLSHTAVTKPKEESQGRVLNPGNPPPERAGIMPQTDVRNLLNNTDKNISEFRLKGFTAAQVIPHGVLLPGSSALIQLNDKSPDNMVLLNQTALYSELSANPGVYPSNILGIMAKWRDLYRNAAQAHQYESLYASNRIGLERPSSDRIMQAFYPVIDKKLPVLFRAEKLLDIHRVLTLQKDLGFSLVLADVREGWDVIPKIKAANAKVFLSLELPEEIKEKEKTESRSAERIALDKRKAEFIQLYESQAAAFQNAGIKFGFCTMDAKASDVLANLRRMIAKGLREDVALAALTTHPAEILGVSDRLGTIDKGKIANLVITTKPFFEEKAKVKYVFVDGQLFEPKPEDSKSESKTEIAGDWTVGTKTPQGTTQTALTFIRSEKGYTGKISGGRLPNPIQVNKVTLEGNVLQYSYSYDMDGTRTITVEVSATVEGDTFKGTATVESLGSFPVEGKKGPHLN